MYGFRSLWRKERRGVRRLCFLFAIGTTFSSLLSATTVVPISDRELRSRADVVVRGVVVSSETAEDAAGRPETVTVVAPLEVLKGSLGGNLVLRQLGGALPDGRFLKIWGRPEYRRGHEVVVFAIARPDGDYQTAELMLGKFEVEMDEARTRFAVPALTADAPEGVTVRRLAAKIGRDGDVPADDPAVETGAPRELESFLKSLRGPGRASSRVTVSPQGALRSVVHAEYEERGVSPEWANIGSLWRWNNGASAVWTIDGQTNVTGGGTSEATAAAATWTDESNSTIGYTIGSGSGNFIHLDALTSPCGWSTCMSGGGVIGCGGPGGSGSNSWRGESYATITNGEVWLRSYCSFNLWDLVTTEAVLAHELGHTLGLGHSDQGVSPHDVCPGDEDLATMRSYVQHRTTLGTDDIDAARWLYGDGGTSCGGGGGPMLNVTKTGAGSGTVTSVPAGISCGATCSFSFAEGTAVTLSAAAASSSVFTGWGGDADCSDGTITMSSGRNCTANFDLKPDVIISVLAAPSSAVAGSAISVSETTKDQTGTGAAAASTTRYYLSANSAWEAADVPLGFRAVPALAPGSTSAATVLLTIPAGTATGNYYILALADADGQLTESNDVNNVKADSIHIGPPDLVVSSVAAPATGGAALSITVTDTTYNQSGTGPAPASVTRFYLSSNSTWEASDAAIGSRNVPALDPGVSSSGSTVLSIPAGTARGTWYVIAKADAVGALTEVSEANNTRSDSIVIGPDLSVSALTVPSTGGAGLPITVTDTTKNAGGGSALASTTSFYLSANSTWAADDVPLGSRSVPLLLPGTSNAVATTLTIPPGTAPASYYLIARADDGGLLGETDENNNTRAVLIRISPDLIVSTLTIPASAAAGVTISVTDVTKNQGQGIANTTTTRFYFSTNNLFDAADVSIGSRAVPTPLASGAASSGPSSLVIPPGTPAGTYYIIARADADLEVTETNEANNNTAKAITITP